MGTGMEPTDFVWGLGDFFFVMVFVFSFLGERLSIDVIRSLHIFEFHQVLECLKMPVIFWWIGGQG